MTGGALLFRFAVPLRSLEFLRVFAMRRTRDEGEHAANRPVSRMPGMKPGATGNQVSPNAKVLGDLPCTPKGADLKVAATLGRGPR